MQSLMRIDCGGKKTKKWHTRPIPRDKWLGKERQSPGGLLFCLSGRCPFTRAILGVLGGQQSQTLNASEASVNRAVVNRKTMIFTLTIASCEGERVLSREGKGESVPWEMWKINVIGNYFPETKSICWELHSLDISSSFKKKGRTPLPPPQKLAGLIVGR